MADHTLGSPRVSESTCCGTITRLRDLLPPRTRSHLSSNVRRRLKQPRKAALDTPWRGAPSCITISELNLRKSGVTCFKRPCSLARSLGLQLSPASLSCHILRESHSSSAPSFWHRRYVVSTRVSNARGGDETRRNSGGAR